ncbi:unnamed protein product, partial [Laminaria digitata]
VAGKNGPRWSEKKSEKRGLKVERVGKGAPAQNGKDVSLETVRPERRERATRTRKEEGMAGRRREVGGQGTTLKEEGSGNENGVWSMEQGLDHRVGSFVAEVKPEPLGSEREDESEQGAERGELGRGDALRLVPEVGLDTGDLISGQRRRSLKPRVFTYEEVPPLNHTGSPLVSVPMPKTEALTLSEPIPKAMANAMTEAIAKANA